MLTTIKRFISNIIKGYYEAKYKAYMDDGVLPCFNEVDMSIYVREKNKSIKVKICYFYYPDMGKMLFGLYGYDMPLVATHIDDGKGIYDLCIRMSVNKAYLDLDKKYKDAIFSHECGHITSHYCNGHDDSEHAELDADNYAAYLGRGKELRTVLYRYKDTLISNGCADILAPTISYLWARIDNLNLQCRRSSQ